MFHSDKLALIAALALVPTASFAEVSGGGEGTTANILVVNEADEAQDVWTLLESEAFDLDVQSDIIVTACSDFDNPGGASPNTYLYTLALDSTAPGLNGTAERTIDELYDDPAEDDPDVVAVCTTRFFPNVSIGAHTINVLAAKSSLAMLNVTVFDTSMTLGAFEGTDL